MPVIFDPILGSLRKADVANSQLADDMAAHIKDTTIHVTQADKDNWNADSELDTSNIDEGYIIIK